MSEPNTSLNRKTQELVVAVQALADVTGGEKPDSALVRSFLDDVERKLREVREEAGIK